MLGFLLNGVITRRKIVGGFLLMVFLFPAAIVAHPLDEYYQITTISVAPRRMTLAVELYPAVLVAPQLLPLMDSDGDETLSEAEQRAYIDRFMADLTFEVDGHSLPLTMGRLVFPTVLDLRTGGSVIRFDLTADLPADHRGDHRLFYQNNHQPDIGVYVVQAQSDQPQWVSINQFERDVFQQSIDAAYTIKADAPVAGGLNEVAAGEASGRWLSRISLLGGAVVILLGLGMIVKRVWLR